VRKAVLLVAWAILAGAAAAQAAPAPFLSTLRITVDGVSPKGGTLRIELHDEATFPDVNALALRRSDVPKIAGDVSVVIDRLPPGDYALRAFQDLNDNGHWDPGEPRATSNGAAAGDFEKAAIGLMPGANMAALHLH
jgi:uncharacterized protein (DUF2141 family)